MKGLELPLIWDTLLEVSADHCVNEAPVALYNISLEKLWVSIDTTTIWGPNICNTSKFLWGALSLNSGFKAGPDMDQSELVGL